MADGQGTTQLADPAAQTSTPVVVDVVIVAYNSRDTLRACVEPLVQLPWVSVTVVDNASPDDSAAVVADLPIRTIRAPRNGGFAYGCNLGTAAGAAEFVLFLNPDAVDRLGEPRARSSSALRADPALGSVGPRTLGDGGELHWTQRRFPRLRSTYSQALGLHRVAPLASWAGEVIKEPAAYARPATPDWLSGACVLMRRAALDDVGGLDEGFFLYSEETDLFRRLRGRGWRARFEPKATAYHQGYGSAPWETVTPDPGPEPRPLRAQAPRCRSSPSGGDRRRRSTPSLMPPPGSTVQRAVAGISQPPGLRCARSVSTQCQDAMKRRALRADPLPRTTQSRPRPRAGIRRARRPQSGPVARSPPRRSHPSRTHSPTGARRARPPIWDRNFPPSCALRMRVLKATSSAAPSTEPSSLTSPRACASGSPSSHSQPTSSSAYRPRSTACTGF